MVKYIDQSYKELIYTLSTNKVININILKSKEIYWNNLFIEFSIIGASHYLNINNELFELFATTKLDIFDYSYKFEEIKDTIYKCDNFFYSFKIIENITEKKFDLEFNYIFPGDNNPETKIFVKIYKEKLLINTFHKYPNEDISIFTETIINIRSI